MHFCTTVVSEPKIYNLVCATTTTHARLQDLPRSNSLLFLRHFMGREALHAGNTRGY